MATPQTNARRASRANGQYKKAGRAAREDLHTAQEAAETFVSAVRSSATHFGEHLGRAVEEKVAKAQTQAGAVASKAKSQAGAVASKAKGARDTLEERVRDHPMTAIGVAAGAGVLLALLSRR